ncbi:hypothetical protein [Streptomyces xanthophaeus]|uniref:hypothetical protein n=1 Tax=Streptomyces xanthophaeus TaxID=67385 RepID=UPI002648E94F|nr:hypothetical protein [Streptomyces xanthophaeus]WKD36536.1 hypothetical protein KO717_34450 [Streptomyces xanthophaeus]
MTPADELRAAADKLRTLSTEASEPPWTVNQWGNVESADFAEAAEVWPLQAKPGANADYIAAMHPGVGAALAELLEDHAKSCDAAEMAANQVFVNEPAERERFIARQTNPRALAVARQILGSQP